jgi:UDP-N-acetyl-D-mannosaminuronate dehydrogenase
MKTMQNGDSSIVIGMGEIGSALQNILKCDYVDLKESRITSPVYETIHVCIPYTENFVEIVKKYQDLYKPILTVIHSTVPIGTSKLLDAVHSPVRGKHPNMVNGIMNFTKFFGGEKSKEASAIFEELGIKCYCVPNSDDTEAMKLWDTTQYGWSIILEKVIWQFCQDKGLDFNTVYTLANQSYNDGYEKLGNPEYKKYILKHVDGKIGGHCVMQNLELLEVSMIRDLMKQINAIL